MFAQIKAPFAEVLLSAHHAVIHQLAVALGGSPTHDVRRSHDL